MNEIEMVRALGRRAVPALPVRDVTAWVMQDIRIAAADAREQRVWQWAAAGACVLAIVAVLVAVPVWMSMENPLAGVGAVPQAVTQ